MLLGCFRNFSKVGVRRVGMETRLEVDIVVKRGSARGGGGRGREQRIERIVRCGGEVFGGGWSVVVVVLDERG